MPTPTPLMRVIEPPDLPAAIGRLVYRDRPGAVVRFTAEMFGTEFMTAYPWSPAHGWSANN